MRLEQEITYRNFHSSKYNFPSLYFRVRSPY